MLQVEKRRAPDRVGTCVPPGTTSRSARSSLGGNESGLARYTLPALALLDPGIGETLAMHVRFAFLRALDAKDSDDHGGVAVNLNIHLLVDRLRRLVGRVFDAGKEFAFGRDAAVVFNCDECIDKKHIH